MHTTQTRKITAAFGVGFVGVDRAVLVEVLVYHWPTPASGCHCGWGVLGASFPEHVADIYEMSVAVRSIDGSTP